jgi:DUF1365 family protein
MTKAAPKLESSIYQGFVRHRRFFPVAHQFDNRIFMLLLKVDEIPLVLKSFWQLGNSKFCWARFRRADYIGKDYESITDAVKSKIAEKLCKHSSEVNGEVYMLANLRYFGFYFSPINLYYLKCNDQFKYMLAEVSNTPWHEKHYYLVDLTDIKPHAKELHVSPFNPMTQNYHWHVIPPDNFQDRCLVHIQAHDQLTPIGKVFDATLSLNRVPLNQTELTRVLLRTPSQPISIVLSIYWQALKLALKRVPFYSHPKKKKSKLGKTGHE